MDCNKIMISQIGEPSKRSASPTLSPVNIKKLKVEADANCVEIHEGNAISSTESAVTRTFEHDSASIDHGCSSPMKLMSTENSSPVAKYSFPNTHLCTSEEVKSSEVDIQVIEVSGLVSSTGNSKNVELKEAIDAKNITTQNINNTLEYDFSDDALSLDGSYMLNPQYFIVDSWPEANEFDNVRPFVKSGHDTSKAGDDKDSNIKTNSKKMGKKKNKKKKRCSSNTGRYSIRCINNPKRKNKSTNINVINNNISCTGVKNNTESFITLIDGSVSKDDDDNINNNNINNNGNNNSSNSVNLKTNNDKKEPSPKIKMKECNELDFVSDDPKENLDIAHPEWENVKKLYKNGINYKVIRDRWENTAIPDPSIDLTCFQYRGLRTSPTVQRNRCQVRNEDVKRKTRRRSKSCVSHYEKMMNDMKNKCNNELNSLFCRQDLELLKLNSSRAWQVRALFGNPMMNMYQCSLLLASVLEEHEMHTQRMINQYKQGVHQIIQERDNLVNLYEKCIAEVKSFHTLYEVDGDPSLTNDQFQHLSDTERMYNEYKKFYQS